ATASETSTRLPPLSLRILCMVVLSAGWLLEGRDGKRLEVRMQHRWVVGNVAARVTALDQDRGVARRVLHDAGDGSGLSVVDRERVVRPRLEVPAGADEVAQPGVVRRVRDRHPDDVVTGGQAAQTDEQLHRVLAENGVDGVRVA